MSGGAKLPNSGLAQVELHKLSDYVLNPDHRLGRHKARVFQAALGLGVEDAETLRASLLAAAAQEAAALLREDPYGVHYAIEHVMEFKGSSALVRSLWSVRAGEDFPRFVTAFVARKDQADE